MRQIDVYIFFICLFKDICNFALVYQADIGSVFFELVLVHIAKNRYENLVKIKHIVKPMFLKTVNNQLFFVEMSLND